MFRILAVLVSIGFLAAPAWAQESEEESAETEAMTAAEAELETETETETETEAEAETAEVEEEPDFDETGLDEQGFADEDDDFDPTEEIATDQSIDFPADI